jgi:predicted small secreted protein
MESKEADLMNWKAFVLGAAAGLIAGYAVNEVITKKVNICPEKVLSDVKSQFKKQGPISGSWIQMEAVPYSKGQINYQVYKGGISTQENGINKQFEFIADASTGTILEVNPLGV